MSYEEFVCALQAQMQERLGETAKVLSRKITKNNGLVLDALSIYEGEYGAAPTIYLNEFYREYEDGMTMPEIVDCMERIYQENKMDAAFDPAFYGDFEKVKPHLFCKVIHRGQNGGLLREVPYIPFLDLAVVAFCRVSNPVMGNGTILVHTRHMEKWGISKDELFRIAKEHTLEQISDEYVDIDRKLGAQEETEAERLIPMYVLSNRSNSFGAVSMIFDSVLTNIGDQLGENFWVLPSSVHECIVIPEGTGVGRGMLENMVREVNNIELLREDFLSDQVYYYDRSLHRLS